MSKESVKNELNEVSKDVDTDKDLAKGGAKAATGNYLGAAKDVAKGVAKEAKRAIKDPKGYAKRKVKQIIITYVVPVVSVIFVAIMFFAIILELANIVKNAIDKLKEGINDYTNTLLYADGIHVTNEQIDEFIELLKVQGISLSDLGIIADNEDIKDEDAYEIEYDTDGNKKDEPVENKKARKYIRAFLTAELVTQTIETCNNGLGVPGGIKLIRDNAESDSEIQLKYIDYAEFERGIQIGQCTKNAGEYHGNYNAGVTKNVTEWYSINNSNQLVIAVKTEENQYKMQEINYRQILSMHNIPAMFFIDLCLVTQNPKYVKALADEVISNTEIELVLQDSYTKIETKTITYKETKLIVQGEEQTTTVPSITTDIQGEYTTVPLIRKINTLLYENEQTYTRNETVSGPTKIGENITQTITRFSFDPAIQKTPINDGLKDDNTDPFPKMTKTKYTIPNSGEKIAAYNSIVDGGEILFSMLDLNLENDFLEQELKNIISKMTGQDFGVEDLVVDIFDMSEFKNMSSAISGSSVLKEYNRKFEGCKLSADGKSYIVCGDGAEPPHPTVGYGIDIENSGFKDRIIAAGYNISMGSEIPVEFVDSLEDEEIKNNISNIQAKTQSLNLKIYQIYALVSRTYNCGEGGALGKRNGHTFCEAYNLYWNQETDDEYGVTQNENMYNNDLYTNYMNKPITSEGKVLRGLVTRRRDEWILFKTGYFVKLGKFCNEGVDVGGGIKQGGITTQEEANALELVFEGYLNTKIHKKNYAYQTGPFEKWWVSPYNHANKFQCVWWAYGRASMYLEQYGTKYSKYPVNGRYRKWRRVVC